MIRIIAKHQLGSVGSDTTTRPTQFKTFDVACPELEAYLSGEYHLCRSVVGAEVIPDKIAEVKP